MNQPRLTAGDYDNLTFRPLRLSDTSSAATTAADDLKALTNCLAEAHVGCKLLVKCRSGQPTHHRHRYPHSKGSMLTCISEAAPTLKSSVFEIEGQSLTDALGALTFVCSPAPTSSSAIQSSTVARPDHNNPNQHHTILASQKTQRRFLGTAGLVAFSLRSPPHTKSLVRNCLHDSRAPRRQHKRQRVHEVCAGIRKQLGNLDLTSVSTSNGTSS